LHRDLIPYIESHYRVQPYKTLVGWSLGGLFSIHAMLSQPEIFNAYIAVSPSLYWNDQIEISSAEKLLSKRTSFNKSLFMTAGNERDEMVNSAKRFSEVLEKYPLADFSWKYETMFEETHSSIKLKSIYEGLEFIFSDLWLIDKISDAPFIDHHRKLVKKIRLRYRIIPQFFIRRLQLLSGEKEVRRCHRCRGVFCRKTFGIIFESHASVYSGSQRIDG
jgi:pimeloyl-ACP methyl ester carboxylesterase